VDVSKLRPVGSEGVIAHEVAVPPLDVGVTEVMVFPFVNVNELGV
jgi:hypothetical protein